jgi:solute carrier family 25, member 38
MGSQSTMNDDNNTTATVKTSSTSSSSSSSGWNSSSFIGGATAGLVSSATLQPFEVIKTRMQTQNVLTTTTTTTRTVSSSSSGSNSSTITTAKIQQGGIKFTAHANNANNVFSTAIKVVQQQGFLALWSGVSASCIRTTCGAGLYFLVLDKMQKEMKQWTQKEGNNLTQFEKGMMTFSVGALSRASIATLLNPITVVKTRLEYGGGPEYKRSVGKMLVDISRKEGMRGLFSGLAPTIMRDAPFSGLNLLLFMKAREFTATLAEKQNREVSAYDTVLCGAFAGGFATFLTQPPDVLRTRLQIQRNLDRNIKPTVTFRTILAERGIRGLYVGAVPRIARRTFQQAITWSLFEFVSRQLGGSGSDNWK